MWKLTLGYGNYITFRNVEIFLVGNYFLFVHFIN
jgi:hypothetical protein